MGDVAATVVRGSRTRSGPAARPAAWVLLTLAAVALGAVLVSAEHRRIFLSGAGVAQGALIAAIALGIVVTYRGSGVVNLANGAVAMFAAYIYAVLRSDGDLFLVDRLKELVVVSGFNVYPSEIEELLAEVDGVAEAAVIGRPDARTGEAVVAFVVPTSHAGLTAPELAERVREHCARRLARFKQPAEITVVEALPHTVTGKVAKGRLRAARRREELL